VATCHAVPAGVLTIEQQEASFRARLNESRKELRRVNEEITSIEAQSQAEVRRSLVEFLNLKKKQIEEHKKIRPDEKPVPSTQLTPEQQASSDALESIATKLNEIEERSLVRASTTALLARKQRSIQNVKDRLRQLERAYRQFEDDASQDLQLLGLEAEHLARLTVERGPLDKIETEIPPEQQAVKAASSQDAVERSQLGVQQESLKNQLNAPQLAYQQNVMALDEWSRKLNALVGTPESPETLRGLEARIAQIDGLPARLTERKHRRMALTGEIFDVLDDQRQARAKLFAPVQDLIQTNSLIRDEYKLQFQATLSGSADAISNSLFALIKQQSGEFRGEDSFNAVRSIFDQHDVNIRSGALSFVTELHAKVERAAAGGRSDAIGILDVLRKDRAPQEVYDLLFGLGFLEPRYTLLFQDTRIEQLSPGQRGALLLIFYLLVDKGRNPIILDQPEENLDNQTVVSLLVPVLTEAKRKRQIIMVTHNPNLAVVCDAEQVIYSQFDRKNGSRITYTAGAIENPAINIHAVNVLEGTKPAFKNRQSKYHLS
jgi:ABC-type Mn2+/Zn2+ transport system ATPase subunit